MANTVDTRFAIASGNKGTTALAVVSLIDEGLLDLGTTARSVLGNDLPLIAADVTVEQLLAHRSGIGNGTVALTEAEPDRDRLAGSSGGDQIARASSSNASISRCFGAASTPSS